MRRRILIFLGIAALLAVSLVTKKFVENDPFVTSFSLQIIDLGDGKLPKLLPELRSGNHKYGFIDKKGSLKIAAQFDDAGDFHEGLAAVRKGDRWGYITTDGTMAIPLQFHKAMNFSNGRAAVKSGRLWGYIDKHGKLSVKPNFLKVNDFQKKNCAVVFNVGSFGLIDRNGNFLIPMKATKIGDFSDGIARVEIESKFGFIRDDGKWLSPPVYEDAGEFSEGLAAFCEKGNWGYIDDLGKVVIKPKFKHAATFFDGAAAVKTADDVSGIIDRRGEFIVKPKFSGLARMLKPNWREPSVISANGMTPFLELAGWGFASNDTGEPVIKPQFVVVNPFSEGMACVGVEP